MRLKQNYNIAKKCSGDIITILPGNTKDGTEDIKIRVIEVILDDGTKEYLATNLFDSHISQKMFRELYFYRWPVETKYKELKSRLAIEEFSRATTTSALNVTTGRDLPSTTTMMPGANASEYTVTQETAMKTIASFWLDSHAMPVSSNWDSATTRGGHED